jgi:hypothetical protein
MNFRLRNGYSVILMSRRPNAPYTDRVENDERVLIYEGHDIARTVRNPHPKQVDQPYLNPNGSPTQNGMFAEAAKRFREGTKAAEFVQVYEKIHAGIWVYNGLFKLVDYWDEQSGSSRVFKFKLELTDIPDRSAYTLNSAADEDDRIVPSWVKLEVWKRDDGRCTKCGSNTGLHFDHVIPYSKGGSSKDPKNIQILCARHNLEKRDEIK